MSLYGNLLGTGEDVQFKPTEFEMIQGLFKESKKAKNAMNTTDMNDLSDDEDTENQNANKAPKGPTPASVAAAAPKQIIGDGKDYKTEKQIFNEKDAVVIDEYDNNPNDGRLQPEHDIQYRQKVSPEDIYLGMSGKNESSVQCDELVVKVKMPGEKFKNIQLDVDNSKLDLRSPKYKLVLHLPHPVDDKRGKAKFDSDTDTLSVTLPIVVDEFGFRDSI